MSSDESFGAVEDNGLGIIEPMENVGESENLVESNYTEPAEGNNTEATEDNAKTQDEEDKKTVKPKRIIRNPQPKLNEQTLQGPKGLRALRGHFDRVKFKGRGHEEHDLNIVLKTYEYWCHRLVPKFSFVDCIARLETLGHRRATQTQIKRIKMGIDFDNDPVLNDNEDDNAGRLDGSNAGLVDGGNVDFVDRGNDQFDQLLPSNNAPLQTSAPQLSEEQMDKIRQNKERAQKLREERLRNIQQKIQKNLPSSQRIMTQNNQLSTMDTVVNVFPSTSTGSFGNDYVNVVPSTSTGSITANEAPHGSNDPNTETDRDDGEDDIDDILDFINADEEPISGKDKILVQDPDSEEEQIEASKNTSKRRMRRCIIESDEDEESDNNKNENTDYHKHIDNNGEDESMDNILRETDTATENVNSDIVILEQNKADNSRNESNVGIKESLIENHAQSHISNIESNPVTENTTHVSSINLSKDLLFSKSKDISPKHDLENDLNIVNIDITSVTEIEKSVSDKIEVNVYKSSMEQAIYEVNQIDCVGSLKTCLKEVNEPESITSSKQQNVSDAMEQVLNDVVRTNDINEPMETTE